MEDISLISNENNKLKVVNLKKEGVNIMRAYDLIIDLLQLEKEEFELSKKLAKTNNVSTRAVLEKEIDRLFAKELDIIKVLKNTKVI